MIVNKYMLAPVAALVLLVGCSPAFAQRTASSKTLNTAYSVNSGYTYQNHAYEQNGLLNSYSSNSDFIPRQVVREHSQAIRSNIEAASKQYQKLQEVAKTNPEAAKKLAEIKDRHAKVIELCDQLDAHSAEGDASAADISQTTDEINTILKSSHEAHKDLSEKLGVESNK